MQELQLVLCKEFTLYNPFELYTLPSLHCNNNMKALALQVNVDYFFNYLHYLHYLNFFIYPPKFPADFMATILVSSASIQLPIHFP